MTADQQYQDALAAAKCKWEQGLEEAKKGPQEFLHWWWDDGCTTCSMCDYFQHECSLCPLHTGAAGICAQPWEDLHRLCNLNDPDIEVSQELFAERTQAMLQMIERIIEQEKQDGSPK